MILSHYCSNNTFTSIVENQEIWLSDLQLSNDTLEGKWTRRVFAELCKEKGIPPYKQENLLKNFDLLENIVRCFGFCLSEEADQLSQWRGYADDGAGISIGFNSDALNSLCNLNSGETRIFVLDKVTYDPAEQRKALGKAADTIWPLVDEGHSPAFGSLLEDEESRMRREIAHKGLSMNFLHFAQHLFLLKNDAFQEEHEWRVFSYAAPTLASNGLIDMSFRSNKNRIVPFLKFAFTHQPAGLIEQIIVGPKNMTPTNVVESILEKHGHTNVKVIRSTASYR